MDAQPVEEDDLVREPSQPTTSSGPRSTSAIWNVVKQRYAPEFVLNSPARNIHGRDGNIELLARTSGRQTDNERTIDAA